MTSGRFGPDINASHLIIYQKVFSSLFKLWDLIPFSKSWRLFAHFVFFVFSLLETSRWGCNRRIFKHAVLITLMVIREQFFFAAHIQKYFRLLESFKLLKFKFLFLYLCIKLFIELLRSSENWRLNNFDSALDLCNLVHIKVYHRVICFFFRRRHWHCKVMRVVKVFQVPLVFNHFVVLACRTKHLLTCAHRLSVWTSDKWLSIQFSRRNWTLRHFFSFLCFWSFYFFFLQLRRLI